MKTRYHTRKSVRDHRVAAARSGRVERCPLSALSSADSATYILRRAQVRSRGQLPASRSDQRGSRLGSETSCGTQEGRSGVRRPRDRVRPFGPHRSGAHGSGWPHHAGPERRPLGSWLRPSSPARPGEQVGAQSTRAKSIDDRRFAMTGEGGNGEGMRGVSRGQALVPPRRARRSQPLVD